MNHPLLEQLADKVFSVVEYLELVNSMLAPLAVSVEGEVTDLKLLPQWTFFALKDADSGAVLRCGLHASAYRRIGVNLEEGMAVKVAGYGKIAPKSGNFGFWVSSIEPVGEGALRRAYELLVKKLSDEGLFVRKRELPPFISHIGVVSSRNGVVIQDLRQNLLPLGIRIDFIHSGVEGADSAPEILRAVTQFAHAKDHPQVLVLIRGGGSLESLQGFNNEAVCRAIFAAPMPVLVGIGHDVDAPIATLVADRSASTPTAVAHVINASWAPLLDGLPRVADRVAARFKARLWEVGRDMPLQVRTIRERFVRRIQRIDHRIELASRSAEHAMSRLLERFARYDATMRRAWRRIPVRIRALELAPNTPFARAQDALRVRVRTLTRAVGDYERLLTARDPERLLARGYGLVYGPGGVLLRSVRELMPGVSLTTRLRDGVVRSTVDGVEPTSGSAGG